MDVLALLPELFGIEPVTYGVVSLVIFVSGVIAVALVDDDGVATGVAVFATFAAAMWPLLLIPVVLMALLLGPRWIVRRWLSR